jgi:hypothetical protein
VASTTLKMANGCSDAQRDRQDGDQAKAGRLAQGAQAEAQVLADGLEQRNAPRFATFFFGLFDSAKLQASAAQGFGARYAAADQIFDASREVKFQLGIHFALSARAPEIGA